ncbi:MAG: YkgJ family cysteine cluster protein [Desulfofustis sp.]|nr:YkgJ family cysteine cluster protein [Desulfofustis sp.]
MKAPPPDPLVPAPRHRALTLIYEVFDAWTRQWAYACRPGCAVCCTHGVTLSETEGERIINYIRQAGLEPWLIKKLLAIPLPGTPTCTTNEFARACLQEEDIDPGGGGFSGICPFLQDQRCSIYPVRPFACRCFVSTITCQPGREAVLPSAHLTASTAVGQLIEHLDQGRYWGTMIALLRHLAPVHVPGTTKRVPERRPTGLLTARPLPGFLIGDEDYPLVAPLLEDILSTPHGEGTIEDLLNEGSFS